MHPHPLTHGIAPLNREGPGLDRLLALNNAHAAELSWLEMAEFERLIAQAFAAYRIGETDAFLLAFSQDADYRSPNFLWFQERFPCFVYVDRVLVAPHARGKGLARQLYVRLFEAALHAGHALVGCEVNKRPPNPASDSFHAALGFHEVGEADTPDGTKTVRYWARALA